MQPIRFLFPIIVQRNPAPINMTASTTSVVAHFTGVFAGVDTFPENTRARGMVGGRI
jgi:hypothetical protein